MYRDDEQDQYDDQLWPDSDDLRDLEQSNVLRFLASLPEPPDTPCPDPSLEELLEEAALPGGSDLIAAEARRRDPGPLTAQMLTVIRPSQLGAAGLLDAACAAERLASWTQATQHHYLAAFARPGVAAPAEAVETYASAPGQPLHRSSARSCGSLTASAGADQDLTSSGSTVHGRPAEERALLVAAALKVASADVSAAMLISPINASRRVAQAVEFTDDLPATLTALRDGVIDRGRALVIADRTQNLPSDLRRRVEARVVPKAIGRTAGQVRGIADRAVIAADPEAAKKRHEAARARRGVGIRPGEDGMSIFRADLTADKSVTAFTVIDQIATANARNSAEKRPIGALRADVFADIFDQLADHGSVHLFLPGRNGAESSPCPHQHPAASTVKFANGTTTPDADSAAPTTRPDDDTTTSDPNPAAPAEATTTPRPPTEQNARPIHRTNPDVVDSRPAPPVETDSAAGDPARTAERFSPASRPADPPTTPTPTTPPTGAEAGAGPDYAPSSSDAPDHQTNDIPKGATPVHRPVPINSPDTASHIEPAAPATRTAEDPITTSGTLVGTDRPSPPGDNPLIRSGATGPATAPHCNCQQPRGTSASAFRGLGTHQGRTTGLNVTIAATTLAGLDDLPGKLDGHGPIPADMARAIAASAATITAVAVDPSCGTALDLGRTTYRPRLAQRDLVVQRDGTCRFVGCRQPAWRCQIDHSDEFCPGKSDGGVTCPCNLQCVCKFHHDLKTFGLWDTVHHPDGSITWISPIKRRYTSQPREWLTGMADDTDADSVPARPNADADAPTRPHADADAPARPDANGNGDGDGTTQAGPKDDDGLEEKDLPPF